jgi:hypothetical protein
MARARRRLGIAAEREAYTILTTDLEREANPRHDLDHHSERRHGTQEPQVQVSPMKASITPAGGSGRSLEVLPEKVHRVAAHHQHRAQTARCMGDQVTHSIIPAAQNRHGGDRSSFLPEGTVRFPEDKTFSREHFETAFTRPGQDEIVVDLKEVGAAKARYQAVVGKLR